MIVLNNAKVIDITSFKKGEYKAILGFAGAGFVGNTSVMFAARSKGYKLVAKVKSFDIPPMILLIDGNPTSSFRIYVDEVDGLLFAVTETLVPAEACWLIAEVLMKWFQDNGVKEIYALEGLPFGPPTGMSTALGFGYKIDINNMGIQTLRDGALSGISSCIMDLCMERSLPFAVLFVPTNRLTAIDYGASANGVELMNRLFKTGVDASPLKQSDETIRRATEQQQKSGLSKVFKRS